MLILKVISTGSKEGNCYLLENEGQILVLDAGIHIRETKRGLNWNLGGIQGVVVTHDHGDHNKSVEDLKCIGIPVFQPYLSENKSQRMQFGCFSVQSFEVPHDGEPCVGFFIKCGGEKILYATDFEYLPVSFKNVRLNHMLIECNHDKELVDREQAKFHHQIRGHCSTDTLIEKVIKENMSCELRTIILCHLSADSCDKDKALEEVQKVVDCPVYVAEKGLCVELRDSDCPF